MTAHGKARQHQPLRELILDMDSSVSETYGQQEGTPYNGHFKRLCYHPLFLFNQFGDLEYAMLRRAEGDLESAVASGAKAEPRTSAAAKNARKFASR